MTGHAEVGQLRQVFEPKMNPLVDTIAALAFAIQAKDPYTAGHSKTVSRLAAEIARQRRLSEADIEEIRLAGIVHDIGKIHLPQYMLHKPTLTAKEYEIMKTHAAWGAKILEPLKQLGIERIVRHHHERYDGQGYPEGLAGDKIPLGARIVAVAEAFDAMRSTYVYNKGRSSEDAVAEMRRCSGTQFDPKIVTVFLDWLEIHGDPLKQQ
jgi:putative nucleotidyltransferase with HDIG domain